MINKILVIERWNIMEEHSTFIHKLKTFKSVKKFVNWWFKERIMDAKSCHGKIILAKTDYKSFANLHIEHEEYTDTFKLEILKFSNFQRGLTINLLKHKKYGWMKK